MSDLVIYVIFGVELVVVGVVLLLLWLEERRQESNCQWLMKRLHEDKHIWGEKMVDDWIKEIDDA